MYFWLNICSPVFLFVAEGGGGEGGSSNQLLLDIFCICRPCNCKIFKFEREEIFSQLEKMILNRKSRAKFNTAVQPKNQPMMMMIINILITSSVNKVSQT